MVGIILNIEQLFSQSSLALIKSKLDVHQARPIPQTKEFIVSVSQNSKIEIYIISALSKVVTEDVLKYTSIPYHELIFIGSNSSLQAGLESVNTPKEQTIFLAMNVEQVTTGLLNDLIVYSFTPLHQRNQTESTNGVQSILDLRALWPQIEKLLRNNLYFEIFNGLGEEQSLKNVPFDRLKEVNLATNVKNGIEYFHLFKYFPTRFLHVPHKGDAVRKFVWNFKEGKECIRAAELVSLAIEASFGAKLNHLGRFNFSFLVIPASSKEKHYRRFSCFSSTVSTLLSVVNGFDYVTVAADRNPMKGSTQKDILVNLTFDTEKIKGNNFIIFDDVITTGRSLQQMCEALTSHGARVILPVFLAKTDYDYLN